ncbi:MAG: hypothetical protein GWO39_14775, partial [Gammaproteobacteria bacterium]|nr:hypothetical protein [Gammaproteobacteria bacterium]NIT64965.1 hypothetical protein [Gammaproteobacteria bacterium]NIV21985.1 hypothetical protein [Gammaproteobacteria bacterium]NIY33544.1 hypothetical protein [Gammaproteobacteria bacterium]
VFLEDGAQVLSAGYDRKLARWKADGELLRGVETPSPITHMVAHEGNARAVTGHDDGSVRVWHLPELELAAEYYRVHQGAVRAVALHAPSGQIASSGRDGRVYLLRPNAQPLELPRPPTDAWSLAFPPDGARLTGGGWFKLFDWDLRSAKLRVLNTAHGGIINGLHYSRDGTYVASISRQLDSSIYFLDPLTGEALQRFRPHELCGGDIRLSPEDAYLATT